MRSIQEIEWTLTEPDWKETDDVAYESKTNKMEEAKVVESD